MALEVRTYSDGAGASQDILVDDVAGDALAVTKLVVAADGSGAGTDLVSDARPMPVQEVYGTGVGNAVTVTTSATAIPTTPQTGRRKLRIQNFGAVVL
jgi:hypothetical protein